MTFELAPLVQHSACGPSECRAYAVPELRGDGAFALDLVLVSKLPAAVTAGPPLCLDLSVEEGLCVRAVGAHPMAEARFGENFVMVEGLAMQIQGQRPSERRLGSL